ncbi:MAG: hypothetical protein LBD58_07950 [Treponema sp.]|jgi:hypothetical protein|nr:hypothetical protein [Treponema sp.]
MAYLPQRKLSLIVLTVYLAFTAFLAESFIFRELNHEHDHNGADGCCSICYEIELAQLLLEGLGRIGVVVLAASVIAYAKKQARKPVLIYRAVITPISLKVKCNS